MKYVRYEDNPKILLNDIKIEISKIQIYSSNFLTLKQIEIFKAAKKSYRRLSAYHKIGMPILREDLTSTFGSMRYHYLLRIICRNCFIPPYKGEQPPFNVDVHRTLEGISYKSNKHLMNEMGTSLYNLRKFELIERGTDKKCYLCDYIFAGMGGNFIGPHRLEYINYIMGLHDKILADSEAKNTNISLKSIIRKLKGQYNVQFPYKALKYIISLHIEYRGYRHPPANSEPYIDHTINECRIE